MNKCMLLLVLSLGFSSCETHYSFSIKETKTLFKNQGLQNVESVLYDRQQQTIYITNGLGYAPGKDGFISKASIDGEHLDLKWIADLNRPTGMALKENTLYVADLFVLLGINVQNGEIIERYNEPIPGSALNDVAIDKHGDIYVSASRLGAVLKLVDEELKLWVQDTVQLKYTNGLMAKDNQLLVAGLNLSRIDINSGTLTALEMSPAVNDLESLVGDGKNGYFLTTVGQSSLFHVTENLEVTPIMSENDYLGDLAYDLQNGTLFIPRGNLDTRQFYISTVVFNQ